MSEFYNDTVPLSRPLYGATFFQAVQRFFKKYATFNGRASRSEYWWVFFALWLIGVVFGILAALFGYNATALANGTVPVIANVVLALSGLFSLAVLVPHLAIAVRRLHDGNFSGWMLLLFLIPIVGTLIVLILLLLPSNPEGARFDI